MQIELLLVAEMMVKIEIIGLSGGLDSSYTAKNVMGLRPLLLHVDAGWNTDQAVAN